MNTFKVFTVSELTFAIKSLLEGNFKELRVRGEISNLKEQSSGHIYFSLKDNSCQISAVLFKGNARNLIKLPKSGDKVIVKGEISLYSPRGSYQIIVREIEFLGIGELLLTLHELKAKLKAKGWFDPFHKKKLPLLPSKIGVVTSPTGSVIQDIINILKRRFSNFHLILNPVKVQGERAAEEIARAIEEFNIYKLVDVIIVGRGGGSLEDLWAFNQEIVAEAIFKSKIPIISAVGHETDYSIADFVSDIRAPTPSAAAEMVIAEKRILQNDLNRLKVQIIKSLLFRVDSYRKKLRMMSKQNIFRSPYVILAKPLQQLDDIKSEFYLSLNSQVKRRKSYLLQIAKKVTLLNPQARIIELQQRLISYIHQVEMSWKNLQKLRKQKFSPKLIKEQLLNSIKKGLQTKREHLQKVIFHLKLVDPKNLLKKGYTILFSEKTHSVILSVKDIVREEKISALLHDGTIVATVDKINGKK